MTGTLLSEAWYIADMPAVAAVDYFPLPADMPMEQRVVAWAHNDEALIMASTGSFLD